MSSDPTRISIAKSETPQPGPAGPRHRNQTHPPRHPHRRVQHRAITGPRDRHRDRFRPRRRRSPHPDPHRTALAGSGDIVPDPATNTLHIRLDPLPTPRHTVAIAELCQALNDTNTTYPGTQLTLRYSTKPHR